MTASASRDLAAGDVLLRCGAAAAVIRPHGAEARAWRIGGRDLLWTPDPAVWPAVSPILFPIVGRLRDDRVRIGAEVAQMGVHGFASDSLFRICDASARTIRLELRDSAATRAIYPFCFELVVDFRLDETTLDVALRVRNTGETALPYACGLHPGFAWPFDGDDPNSYQIEFEFTESCDVPVIGPTGLFERARRRLPLQGRTLALSHGLLADEALCFLDAASRRIRFASPSGRAIEIETRDFPHFAVWSRPPAPYLCLESWTGHGDPADFDGDVFAKPSMRSLRPGEWADHSAAYRFV